jgi:Ice-binding-like
MLRTTTHHSRTARQVAMATFAALLSAAPFQAAIAQTVPYLGSARSFAVLSGAAVTCTDSTITGDAGAFAQSGSVSQTHCAFDRTVQAGDASAVSASNDFLGAYDELAALAPEQCDAFLSGSLANVSLPPGVYCFGVAATLTGQLTLDGPANGVWIFRVGAGALTATNFSVVMSGGGQACNVYWWVAGGATMTTSNFQGTILAGAATSFTGGSLIGRDLAKGAVTLTGATVVACSP